MIRVRASVRSPPSVPSSDRLLCTPAVTLGRPLLCFGFASSFLIPHLPAFLVHPLVFLMHLPS